eukprot:364982-Chlamydomonas_euryale.AAC.8
MAQYFNAALEMRNTASTPAPLAQVSAVVSQPGKPKGRGNRKVPILSPVEAAARELGLADDAIMCPAKAKDVRVCRGVCVDCARSGLSSKTPGWRSQTLLPASALTHLHTFTLISSYPPSHAVTYLPPSASTPNHPGLTSPTYFLPALTCSHLPSHTLRRCLTAIPTCRRPSSSACGSCSPHPASPTRTCPHHPLLPSHALCRRRPPRLLAGGLPRAHAAAAA